MTLLSPSIRDAMRCLHRRARCAPVVTLVLALGLGVTIAVFTVLDALVLRPFSPASRPLYPAIPFGFLPEAQSVSRRAARSAIFFPCSVFEPNDPQGRRSYAPNRARARARSMNG